MLDPIALFQWEPHIDQRSLRADTLVVTLGSYVDAGHTQRVIDAHLLEHLPNRVIGRFDADQVLDYAGRRPPITFDRDHFADYTKPEINLHLVSDRDGRDFLLLNGPEPALQWERMADSIRHVAQQLDVKRTLLVQSMPAPTPHTRPVAVTRYASDPDLVADQVPVLGTFQLSASFTGVLTVRLGEAGLPALGLVAHVPHYIAENDYPAAAHALVKALRETAHLALPTDGFALAEAAVRTQIDAQVRGNEELEGMIEALERAHDQFMAEHELRTEASGQLPSADEIGQQFERFLAGLSDDERGGDGPGEPPFGPPEGDAS